MALLNAISGKDGYLALINSTSTPLGSGVASVTVGTAGTGYTSAPTVAFTGGGGGTGAAAYATLTGGGVGSIVVTNEGTGYTTAPGVTLTGGGGTGAAATAVATGATEPCNNVTTLPGASGVIVYPPNQAFMVTGRTRKILDPLVPLLVYVNGVLAKQTDYKVLYGSGTILFRVPLGGTPVVTLAGNYRPTVTGTDVIGLQHVNDWSIPLTAGQVPGDEYGTDLIPNYRGKFAGTFSFMRHSSSTGLDLYYLMLLQTDFCFAMYESLQANRIWLCQGDLSASPQNAPSAAMASGSVTGTLKYLPAFLNEPL